MPIYEFVCSNCGHGFEELVGAHVGLASEDVRCLDCGSEAIERQISGYAPIHRRLTDTQKRRLDAERPRVLERNKAELSRKRKQVQRARDAARRRPPGGGR